MPWSDWQFWVVTVLAACGCVAVVRAVVPKRRARRTRLTISGAAPSRTRASRARTRR